MACSVFLNRIGFLSPGTLYFYVAKSKIFDRIYYTQKISFNSGRKNYAYKIGKSSSEKREHRDSRLASSREEEPGVPPPASSFSFWTYWSTDVDFTELTPCP